MKKSKAKAKPKVNRSLAFKVGQRVTVIDAGSFAVDCSGVVAAVRGDVVSVMLDHKQAAKEFRAADLGLE